MTVSAGVRRAARALAAHLAAYFQENPMKELPVQDHDDAAGGITPDGGGCVSPFPSPLDYPRLPIVPDPFPSPNDPITQF